MLENLKTEKKQLMQPTRIEPIKTDTVLAGFYIQSFDSTYALLVQLIYYILSYST